MSGKEYYLDTLTGLNQWQEKRAGLNLLKVKIEPSGIGFNLLAESSMNNLCLAIISGRKIKLNTDLKQSAANQYQLTCPKIRPGENKYYLGFEKS
jgi:hypothetical protein